MGEILLIDKPKGITSFDCIRILRRRYPRGTKLGHAGTLDPMATGLMLIGVGAGTKKLHEFLKLDKTYEAEILLGTRTDTGDITGKILESQNINISKYQNIPAVLSGMLGKLELPVPAYSAIKRGGEPLYKKARRGEKVDAPVKTMEIRSAEFLGVGILPFIKGVPEGGGILKSSVLADSDTSFGKGGISLPVIKARFDVASGTYIRSLAEELGRRLGVPATLAGLRRTRIGEFNVEDADPLTP